MPKKKQEQEKLTTQEHPKDAEVAQPVTPIIITRREFLKRSAITIGALTFIGAGGMGGLTGCDVTSGSCSKNGVYNETNCTKELYCQYHNYGNCLKVNTCHEGNEGQCPKRLFCEIGIGDKCGIEKEKVPPGCTGDDMVIPPEWL